ncbi:MAG TPA: hypothetical protein VH280_14685 [Verrucomicrobiae bacterium]|jgi:hypothetical protein|nr:hypothetical protein [Verrucomicrobiae bacterium]
MRSHFLPQKITAACAVAGATTLLGGSATAQTFVAADYATNSIYVPSWSASQNGGYGFGPWSFDGTTDDANNPDAGSQQTMSSAAAIGTSWTLFNLSSSGGISIAGRSFSETNGMQPGQTFETVIQNPTSYAFYRGFDILFANSSTNLPAGDNTSALRMLVFNYYSTHWKAVDSAGTTVVPLSTADTGAAGLKFDLTLLSTNTYSLTMTPLGNSAAPYTHTGTLSANLPINYVTYRLWANQSTGSNDLADNLEISSMTIEGLPLNIQMAGTNTILSWLNIPGYYLESATSLGPPANWTSNTIPPTVVSGENFVTNPVIGRQQYFRLQLQQ